MAVRARTTINTRQLDALNANIDNFDALMREAMDNAAQVVGDSAIETLQETPGPSKHPFVWSNNDVANKRAAAWYFAAIARGEIDTDGTRYRRTGTLAKAWQYRVSNVSGGLSFVIENTASRGRKSVAKYVYGGFGPNGYTQIPGHRRTGWIQANPVVQAAQDEFLRELGEQVPRLLMNGVITRRNR